MNYRNIIICLIMVLIASLPASATNNVSVNASSSNGSYDTSAIWTELTGANLTVATGTGFTYVLVSLDAKVNYSAAKLYARIKRDGSVISQYNITEGNTYIQTYTFTTAATETTGTHKYGLEVYSTAGKKATIYSWNMSLIYLSTGSYGSGGAGAGNVSSVTGAPAGVLDCTGTDDITCTISPAGTNFRNDTISTHTSQISTLQGNDTTDRAYVNNTFLPISTYSSNFPNTTVAANLANWNATYNASYAKGLFQFQLENGTNVIEAGYSGNFTTGYAGSLVKLLAHSSEVGSINVSFWNTTAGTYIDSVVISSGTDASTTLNYAFGDEWQIRYNVTSVTDIKKVTITGKTLRS